MLEGVNQVKTRAISQKETVSGVRAARELDEAIARSRSILELRDDWDEAGALGYEEETWARAVALLRRHAAAAMAMGGSIGVPRILPGPGGSIDLHWRSADFEILLNIPEEENRPVEFYGDDHSGSVLRGTLGLGPDSKPALLQWLIHR